ncbi:MAG: glycosyltransferase family 2 protein [Anaerolineales bacterium]|nr:glycosyltransferase family 2 protein [Anaerolineales bacterium]
MIHSPLFSIVIPVYNGGDMFKRCLEAMRQSSFNDWELVVVDDGSSDGSDHLAEQSGARVLRTKGRLGPAAARNLGAQAARGYYLYFIDADCELHPDTLTNIARVFRADPGLDALFGSYDDAPGAANFIAQYKNLFHHYVHQNSSAEASTFWTGCGAIRRSQFLALGGFDLQRYRRPAIEDIDLGFRLKQAGGRIRLAKHVQVKHLKAWTFISLLKSDIFDRGIPWTRLILRDKAFTSDLNLQTHNRVSVVAIYGLLLAVAVSLFQPQALLVALGLAALLLWLNLRLYRFFYQKRGVVFTLQVIPLHWLYYLYNALSFGCGMLLYWHEQLKAEAIVPPNPLVDGIETDGN